MQERRLSITIEETHLPCTVASAMKRFLGMSEHQIRRAKFREHGISVNGHQCRVTQKLQPGDRLEIRIDDEVRQEEQEKRTVFVPMPPVLYEDQDLLAVNKPAGMPVHRGRGHYGDTLADAVESYFGIPGKAIHIVGRLDADTSGIVLIAKHQMAAERLKSKELVHKTYEALVYNEIDNNRYEIRKPMRKDVTALNRMEIAPNAETESAQKADGAQETNGALDAVTHCTVIGRGEGYTHLSITLETGRTHQIRLHLASEGHPLLGDPIYGFYAGEAQADYLKRSGGLTRAALHCAKVELVQPFTGERIELTAPLPEDMQAMINGEKTYD